MATRAQWISAARPRTLPAAIAPVLVGTGAAAALDGALIGRALLALVVALALQVGVNYANDYSDGIRGTDDDRVGPFRLTGSGAADPATVRRAAFAGFAVAAASGLALVALSGTWWLIAVGAASIIAAWYYTGGSRPYGYAGLGEVFVFVFFGLVAVLGTTYTQAGRVGLETLAGAVAIGLLACAILVANNLRDVPTDTAAGKHTLAVRIGAPATRRLYAALVAGAFVLAVLVALRRPAALITLVAVPAALPPVRAVLRGDAGLQLLPVLRDTGRLELVYAVLLGLALALG
ncbi:MAG: 1,4-dihydroxy-2-naphthoate polyprenyltransferase [Kineosporiaceae bacterium]|nr:1,4-dihydroxy-2-naphthoate polyprenyltransferase [Kineosporiaceae bacterium]MBK8075773.1 1,4-dihydroxy-2-naphthoate polyprenyltransferase [Kineosporiaceae bacterium]